MISSVSPYALGFEQVAFFEKRVLNEFVELSEKLHCLQCDEKPQSASNMVTMNDLSFGGSRIA